MKDYNILKADNRKNIRAVLHSFLDETAPKLSTFLHQLWKEQENAISYQDLREALLDGEINTEWFQQWQQDYSQFVTEYLQPLWILAVQEAARQRKENSSGWTFDPASDGIKRWTSQRGAAFVTNCTEIQKNALQAVISRMANTGQNVDALAKLVRPMIGLTRPQSVANANYVKTLREKHVPPKRVKELAMKYAARQHRYRAQMIARTELAFAFNQGTLEWARQAQAEGYLGKAVKIWISARDERCCDVCRKLDDDQKEVPLDEPFPFKTRLSDPDAHLAPPAHPHCRCAIDIKEIEPPRFDYIEEIEAPKPLPASDRYDIIEEIPKPTLTNATGVPIIIVDRTKTMYTPNSITQVIHAKGGIERNYYGSDGKWLKQISSNDHGHPKNHPYGQHGEHAHDIFWEQDKMIDRTTRELNAQEREENSDIL